MGYLVVSFMAALAMSVSVYNDSGSILSAFIAYSLTGTCVLLSALLSEANASSSQDQFRTTE